MPADPYGKGWLVKLKADNPAEINALFTADQYQAKVESSDH
ncbi:MAG: hypothetical protein ACKO5E_14600 [bacterium]